MKKLLLIITLGLALTGCATIQQAFKSYNNPVTKEMLYTAENTAVIAFSGLKAYKTACQQGNLPPSCRQAVAEIQVRTRKIPALLRSLRQFVKNNDQVNAITAYRVLTDIFTQVKAIADLNSIKVQ